MTKTDQIILLSSGLVALAILGGSAIIATRVSRTLDEKNFWAGSGVPDVARDVHQVTQPIAGIISAWTRA